MYICANSFMQILLWYCVNNYFIYAKYMCMCSFSFLYGCGIIVREVCICMCYNVAVALLQANCIVTSKLEYAVVEIFFSFFCLKQFHPAAPYFDHVLFWPCGSCHPSHPTQQQLLRLTRLWAISLESSTSRH